MTETSSALRRRSAVLLLASFLCSLALGLPPEASAAASGFFSPIGSMSVPRTAAVAAPLRDGRVLIAGGRSALGDSYSSAEVFNPATNTFSSAGIGSMSVPRYGPVAAALPDGRVLVAGGLDDGDHDLSSAEVFDPATNSFSSAGIGSMSVPRYGPVAAPLPDGRVMVAGGLIPGPGGPGYSIASASAEVFNPATRTFSPTGSMSVPDFGRAAAPLPDGRVLVAGGFGSGSSSAEAFDPATDSFSTAGIGSMTVRRLNPIAAPLPGGRVLVAGGDNGDHDLSSDLSSAEIFAPVSCRGAQATIIASYLADRGVMGTPGADVIVGLDGNDELYGLRGNDVICGGNGKDALFGQNGNDKLSGQSGNDTIAGESGKDIVKGGPGKDILIGGPGKDILRGGRGKDILKGGPGKDKLVQ